MKFWLGVHRIESEFNGNVLCTYLLRGADKTILIDSGVLSTPEEVIFPYLDSIDVAPSEIDTVIVTHAAADHFGGNAALRTAAPDVQVVAHRLDVGSITNLEHYLDASFTDAAQLGCPWPAAVSTMTRELFGPPVPVDWVVEGGETIELSEVWSVTLLHTPGHTPGHLSVWDPRHRVVFAGDAILGRGVTSLAGVLDSPPPYFDADDYLNSVAKVKALRPAYILGTHYPVMQGDEVVAFLEESQAFVERCEATLLATLDEVETLTLCEAVERLESRVGPPAPAWRRTARAHLNKLVATGQATMTERPYGIRWTRTRRS